MVFFHYKSEILDEKTSLEFQIWNLDAFSMNYFIPLSQIVISCNLYAASIKFPSHSTFEMGYFLGNGCIEDFYSF